MLLPLHTGPFWIRKTCISLRSFNSLMKTDPLQQCCPSESKPRQCTELLYPKTAATVSHPEGPTVLNIHGKPRSKQHCWDKRPPPCLNPLH